MNFYHLKSLYEKINLPTGYLKSFSQKILLICCKFLPLKNFYYYTVQNVVSEQRIINFHFRVKDGKISNLLIDWVNRNNPHNCDIKLIYINKIMKLMTWDLIYLFRKYNIKNLFIRFKYQWIVYSRESCMWPQLIIIYIGLLF